MMTTVVVVILVIRLLTVSNVVVIHLLGGILPIEDVAMMYLIEMIQLLGGQHLLGGNEATVDLPPLDMILETILVTLVIEIVIRLNVQIGNVIAPFKPPVSLSIWTKMKTMMIGLLLPMAVT
jgi:hypothetical protein